MARSHVCSGCGNELATLRAPPDPIYKLHLVICPRCERPSVRTRASVELGFRRVKRAARSWLALLAQAIMLALFLTAIMAPYLRIEDLILRDWRLGWGEAIRAITSGTLTDETRDADAMAMLGVPVGIFVAGAVGLGAWLRFGLGHWKLPVSHGVWIIVVLSFLTVPPLVELARSQFITGHVRIDGLAADERVGRLAAACASALVAIAGTPLGRMLDQTWKRQRARLLAKRRRKIRELRRPPA
ncbi:MAG: hypothetical protein RIB60_03180 [Phycisphaerales bacterium]